MKNFTFYVLDVFAEEKYTGNQLAVVREAAALSDGMMQKITKEMNYSETTFILSDDQRNGGYDVRIFTPEQEVPFAGHPTLGTAYVIQHEIIKEPAGIIILNLKAGRIPVTFQNTREGEDILWMKQMAPVFSKVFDADDIVRVLTIEKEDIDEGFPIQEVSTGLPFIIVPLRTLDAVKRARTNKDELLKLIEDTQAKMFLIFCPETYGRDRDLNVRVFCDYYGIPEDPATGSGNGCLAGYLVKHRYFGSDKIDIRIEQGYEIGRPSQLFLKAERNQEQIDVSVGGKVIMVARGELI